MGYSERHCVICGGGFNMARLRKRGESLANAWDRSRDYWIPNGDELILKLVDGRVMGYWPVDGEFRAQYPEGEGIKAGSACECAGCDESEGDHACGGLACEFVLDKFYCPAYNGWRVSAEEMKIMTCVQTIVRPERANYWEEGEEDMLFGKESNEAASRRGYEWEPEEDDDIDERTSKYKVVLTALSESAPYEFEVNYVRIRHGIGGSLSMCESSAFEFVDCSIPFHAPCLQICKRVAKKRFPELNVLDGIWKLWSDELSWGNDRLFHGVDVYWNAEQSWTHVPGTEYLATNPCDIPKLTELIRTCVVAEKSSSTSLPEVVQQGDAATQLNSSDPFRVLPPEIKSCIAELLSMQDIQNLRSSSRAWRQLPQSFYYGMVLKEMPWLWEIEDLAEKRQTILWATLWQRCKRADGGQGQPVEVSDKVQRPPNYNAVSSECARLAAKTGWPLVTFKSLSDDHGQRINGLVNRKRVWKAAETMIVKMQEALSDDKLEHD